MRIEALSAEPFPIPLKEPFTISRASVDSTRAMLVHATVSRGGEVAQGLGEAALPLGSDETLEEIGRAVESAARGLEGMELESLESLSAALDAHLAGPPTARAGAHSALVDAMARLSGEPLYKLFGATAAAPMVTDITLPIASPAHLAQLAVGYWAEGFRSFKVKVGARLADDQETVAHIAAATPGAALRFDANEGFTADQALELLRFSAARGLAVECFEQPCARADIDGMCRVRDEGGVPVVADEAVRDARDLDRLYAAGAIDGINLKLVKMGGADRCLALGRRARERGLSLMVGAMIESRLGLTTMAHVVAALGGVEWVDLDTAFLLARDPFDGGMQARGATLSLTADPGTGMTLRR